MTGVGASATQFISKHTASEKARYVRHWAVFKRKFGGSFECSTGGRVLSFSLLLTIRQACATVARWARRWQQMEAIEPMAADHTSSGLVPARVMVFTTTAGVHSLDWPLLLLLLLLDPPVPSA